MRRLLSLISGRVLLIGLMLVCVCAGYANGAETFSLNGYFKNYSIAIDRPDVDDQPGFLNYPVCGAVNNRLRLNLSLTMTSWASLAAEYELTPRIQDPSLFIEESLLAAYSPSAYRVDDFDGRLYPKEGKPVSSFAVFHNLDRLFVTLRSSFADWYIGRQAIAWGSARVINPTDVVVPYAFNELDIENRLGTDAVRMRIPLGFMGEFDAGYVAGDDFRLAHSAAFVRTRFYYRQTDFVVMASAFRENLLFGIDFTRAIGGAGFWFESAYVWAGAIDAHHRLRNDDYFRVSIGVDYSLRNGTYLFAEYHFNQAGASEPDEYSTLIGRTAYREGAVYLLGRNYLTPGITYQITPLLTLSGELLVNLTDPSAFFMPAVEYNIAKNIYLASGAYVGLGSRPTYVDKPGGMPKIVYDSEFGAYPDYLFTSFRVYF